MRPKPKIYGYLQVSDDANDTDICRIERDLRSFADTEGFCLADIFYEYVPSSQAAFFELTHELRRANARNVVVPSLEHLSAHPLIRDLMLTHLQHRVGAQVWTVEQ